MALKRKVDAADAAADDASRFLEDAQRHVDFTFSPTVVLPGDDVTDILTKQTKHVRLGAGLRQVGEARIISSQAGVLRYRPPNRYWVEFDHKRYSAHLDDGVIGVVTDRNADFYRVNIGAASAVTLGALAFDGATKRNRPSLRIGSLVYARVLKASKDMEPELTCEAPPNVAKKDWMTGLAIYGELNGGYVFKTSIGLAKKLLHEDSYVLQALGKSVAFEIAIGLNGVIWVNSRSPKHTIVVTNAVLNSETMTPSEIDVMVQQLIATVRDA
ncbi:hypothetical protein P43SY_007839 [Pythium insidiosum]|uniref:Ribosomal RNA-processing protein 40 n=1 Tax=Pythium insidiosum TaxID=114742 RepID=A0AAD5M331_PYTIN|nr:hypothetical protein P43SY_007839 [Pythium insidiosum]